VRCEGCGVRYEELRAQGSEQRVEKKDKIWHNDPLPGGAWGGS
jgi:hypothetical protein